MLTKDQAIDKLVHLGQKDLAELVYYAHKDQYGIKGHHLLSNSVSELVSWYIVHYTFNEEFQCWQPVVPFEE